jgi:hypothetical protein
MDDDFILCDDFLNTIVDLYFEKKEEDNKILAIAPHLWSTEKNPTYDAKLWKSRKTFIDGIGLIDSEVIKYMNYKMKSIDIKILSVDGSSAFAWTQIGTTIKNMGGIVYRNDKSYVYHDGNDESKLHPNHRNKEGNKLYTVNFIG